MIVTKELIESFRTSRRGFTNPVLMALAGTHKPTKGWAKRAIGNEISDADILKIRKSIERRNNINIAKGRIFIKDDFLAAVKKKPKKKIQKKPKVKSIPWYNGDVNTPEFLLSYEWRIVRMVALKRDGAKCCCCGASPKTGSVMHVDHIKPRRKYPHLALDPDNLQVLCSVCNHGKSNWDSTDWRK